MVGIKMRIMCWITGRTEVVPSWRSSTPVTYGWLDIWEQHKVGRITLEPASLPKLPLRITLDLAICSVSQLGGEQSQPRLGCAWRAAANRPCLWQCRPAEPTRMVWLLDQEYDRDHRALHMTERTMDLHPLKIRYHGTVDIPYDERYTEHIQPTGLLPFISLVSRGGLNMNTAALTALVDRWRPETHTFHLRAGEMTPILQDVSMILGLPIQGEPLCMNTASEGWRQQMQALIGMAPPTPANPKERAPAGVSFSWIRTNFRQCPNGANEDTIRTYTRVYLWYMISRTLFPDSGGKLAHWCWLKALTVLEHRWSWGTAALAYLYRQVMICSMYYFPIVVC
ncbi:serine/threonine-protein phosphatase 7 long form homolog [Lolium perenne]|uniref:serine/threonine-protein phosphatase 7 long form homolog n=1 Tax=Lolium perenne TaxID=4522 RepID=UPI003A9A609D